MLLYPLVAAAETVARGQVWDFNVGRHNAVHAAVYAVGTMLFLGLTVYHV